MQIMNKTERTEMVTSTLVSHLGMSKSASESQNMCYFLCLM